MSGPKAADVQLQLDRAMAALDKRVKSFRKNAGKFGGGGDGGGIDLMRRNLKNISPLSRDDAENAREEAARIEEARRRAASQLDQAEAAFKQAGDFRRAAEEKRRQVDDCIRDGNALAKKIVGKLSRGREHYLEKEMQQARRVQDIANQAGALEDNALRDIQAALDSERQATAGVEQARLALEEAESATRDARTIAAKRRELARIAEENLRLASQADADMKAVLGQVSGLNHEKFAPGLFQTVKKETDLVAAAFSSGRHEDAVKISQAVLSRFRGEAAAAVERQNEWERRKKEAESDLDGIGREAAALDKVEMAEWSGEAGAVDAAYAKLTAASKAFQAEDFSRAREEAAAALAELRRLNEKTLVNRDLVDKREQIAEAIMEVLCDQNYDTPVFYFDAKRGDGQDDLLSLMTVFAQAPGGIGDVRMKINLEGNVDLNLDGIKEGSEEQCRAMVENLQQGLEGEVDFHMTDWGRAAGVERDMTAREVRVEREVQTEREREVEG